MVNAFATTFSLFAICIAAPSCVAESPRGRGQTDAADSATHDLQPRDTAALDGALDASVAQTDGHTSVDGETDGFAVDLPAVTYNIPADGSFGDPPAGAVIRVAAGTYSISIEPKDHQVWIGTGVVLDGNNSITYAFSGAAKHVVIHGFEVRHYANPPQRGAIDSKPGTFVDGGWVVSSVYVHHNTGAGVHLQGNDAKLLNSTIEYNEQMGFGMQFGEDQLVENNEVAYNNYLDTYDWGWEAGGCKNWHTKRLTLRGNNSHHNHGPGLWNDFNNLNTLIENNKVHDNVSAPGIFHEISYDAIIRGNEVWNCGFPDKMPGNVFWIRSGIHVASSRNVEIYNNKVRDSAKGISGTDQCRTNDEASDGPWELVNVRVHDNVIENSNESYARTDCGATIDMTYANNTWIGNNSHD